MAKKRQEDIRAVLARHGQEHVLTYWDELAEPARRKFASQLESFDYEPVDR